jgi:hypothetical protein
LNLRDKIIEKATPGLPGRIVLYFSIAQAQLSAFYLMHCTGKGGTWKIIYFCFSIAQAQLSAIG